MRLMALLLLRCEAVLDLLTDLKMPRGLALDLREQRLYWAEDGAKKIRSATLDGQDLKDVIVKDQVQEAPRDVAIDPTNQKIYWTALCCGLRRADLNGSNEEVIANAEFASGVAVLDDYVYWADWMHGTILRHHVVSGEEEAIVSGLASPVDVALDAEAREIYWSDVGLGRTQRASLGGNNVQSLNMSWAIMNTYGMAVDTDAKKLYMADFEKTGELSGRSTDYSGRIIRTNLDGSGAEVLVREPSMSMPYGVAVDADASQVYWTDRKAGRIQRLTLMCRNGTKEVRSRTNVTVVSVEHGEVFHGSSTTMPCPAGYNGTVTFACNDDDLTLVRGKCGKRCAPGTVEYRLDEKDPFSRALDYPDMDDGEELPTDCPGSLVGTVQLKCQDGAVLLREDQCRAARSCSAGEFLLGHALIQHSAMDHGIMEPSSCPSGFEGQYFLQCQDGEVIPKHNSSCRATCDAVGSLWVDDGRVEVSHGKIIEGGKVKVVCPTGSAGQGVHLACEDGYINVTESTCKRSSFCQAGYINSGGASVFHDNLDDKEEIVLACPEGFSGSLDVTCEATTILTEGSCQKGCTSGVVILSDLTIPHGDVGHGQAVQLDCPAGYTGILPFVCMDGNMTCTDCLCIPKATGSSKRSDLPIAAFAAGVTAAVLLLLFAAGVLWHRMLKRRAMAAAVAAAVGDIPAPLSSSCLDILPKTGVRSGHSSTSAPTASSGRGSTASTGYHRADTDVFEVVIDPPCLPLYWATKAGIHIFPDPNRIAEVQQLMTDTWLPHFTRDRQLLGGGRVPIGCRVANVLRVENHRSYARYLTYKDALRLKRSGPCTPFPLRTSNRINLLDDDVNESYLFHGTNPESAQCIARDFFRMERAGSSAGSMFGPGIYLAENASKSDEYAKEGSGVYLGLCATLLCRCAVGQVLTVPEARDTREAVRAGGFDSVCGDRLKAVGTFREMVFFQEEAVYPEFIVIYTRVFE
ncbi:unnamed protein product [Durusdinium trenchii]|uniref:PARP catalytic domain-containing protein n=1 Tax=Durusdinium trenchii TaxID=1381693 RepID=A0ABP0LRA8_9DINO